MISTGVYWLGYVAVVLGVLVGAMGLRRLDPRGPLAGGPFIGMRGLRIVLSVCGVVMAALWIGTFVRAAIAMIDVRIVAGLRSEALPELCRIQPVGNCFMIELMALINAVVVGPVVSGAAAVGAAMAWIGRRWPTWGLGTLMCAVATIVTVVMWLGGVHFMWPRPLSSWLWAGGP